MAREPRTPPPTPLTEEELNALLFKNSAEYKTKTVDLDCVITRANVKKYLTIEKLNNKPETWLSVIKKVEDGQELSADETDMLAAAKQKVSDFLEDASKSQKDKFGGAESDNGKLREAVSSFKYKFSVDAFEVITHVVNLFVREITLHALESCLAAPKCPHVVQPYHIPWTKLHDKLLAGMYFNTLTVYNELHDDEDENTEATEEDEVVDEEDAPIEETTEVPDDITDSVQPDDVSNKEDKIKLRQYISTLFKSLCASEARFNSLKISRKYMRVINDIIYQTLDRYANVLKSLLDVSNSKTVNGKFAIHATKIILQDHIYSSDETTRVVLDVVQDRLERLHELASKKKEEQTANVDDSGESPVSVEQPVETAPVKKTRAKK